MRKITQRLTALMMASWLYVAGALPSTGYFLEEPSPRPRQETGETAFHISKGRRIHL